MRTHVRDWVLATRKAQIFNCNESFQFRGCATTVQSNKRSNSHPSLKKYLKTQGLFFVPGLKLNNQVIQAGLSPQALFLSSAAEVEAEVAAGLKDWDRWGPLSAPTSPQSIFSLAKNSNLIGFYNVPANGDNAPKTASSRTPISTWVVCDGLKDPGNLGTVIRSSAAAGISAVVTTNATMGVWNYKVLSTSSGAHFKVPLHAGLSWDQVLALLDTPQTMWYLADPGEETTSSRAVPYYLVEFSRQRSVIVIGGEAHGLSKSARQVMGILPDVKIVTIPQFAASSCFSSGVAASVLTHEAFRQSGRTNT